MWGLYLILGLAAGVTSGFFGIGGATILIPILVFLFGLTQHQAQGTTLAIMVPPIGLLAAMLPDQRTYLDQMLILFMGSKKNISTTLDPIQAV